MRVWAHGFFVESSKYNGKMKPIWRRTLLLMWMALAWGSGAAQILSVPPGASSVPARSAPEAEDSGTPKPGRDKLRRLTEPSEASTQALQAGFLKLKRLCEYGSSAPNNAPYDPPLIGVQTRNELALLARTLEKVTNDFRQTSRITTQGRCTLLPPLLLMGDACRGFKDDQQVLKYADQTAKRLITQAQTRLDLYDQYLELEHQGCTRPGFARKLWASEESNLWPLLLEAPAAFKQYFSTAATN